MLQLQEADCYSVYVAAVQPVVAQKLDAMVSTLYYRIVYNVQMVVRKLRAGNTMYDYIVCQFPAA
jgi:hypothetical protein